MHDLHEYTGVIHVHTAYSDSAGRMPYVIDCAKRAGLDYVVVSDHDSLRAKHEGWDGWHEDVLLVIGVEVSSTLGHTLALDVDECPRWRYVHPNRYLPELAKMGATSFVAHPDRHKRGNFRYKAQDWPGLRTECYAGIELWSYMHDWVEWAYPWHIIAAVRDPDRAVAGPHADVLRDWDNVAQRRHCAGIGALDSHELRLPIPKLPWSLVKILPMDYVFHTVRTHALMPQRTGDGPADIAALTATLAAGRCFVAYDLIGDSTGSQFAATCDGEAVSMMGDEIEEGGELEFRAAVPLESEIALLRDGEAIANARGTELTHRDARPGVYRIEARLKNRPWLFTNHIYVR